MIDKVQKIYEEVERLQNELIQEKEKGYGSDADDACILELQNVLTYIDSLQKEPVSIWHDMSEEVENCRNIIIIDPKNFYGAVLRKGGSQLRNHNKERYVKWAYIDDIINVTNKEEPVSEDLEVELTSYMENSFTSVEEPDEFLTTVMQKDNRLRFQDGRLYITQTPFKDGKQIDFPEMVDITEDVLNTFIEIIKERDRNRCK